MFNWRENNKEGYYIFTTLNYKEGYYMFTTLNYKECYYIFTKLSLSISRAKHKVNKDNKIILVIASVLNNRKFIIICFNALIV